MTGVRVHRGFQDWGSVDTYEFQLQCNHLDDVSLQATANQAAKMGGAGEGSSGLADYLIATMGADEALRYVQSMFGETSATSHKRASKAASNSRAGPPVPGRSVGAIPAARPRAAAAGREFLLHDEL